MDKLSMPMQRLRAAVSDSTAAAQQLLAASVATGRQTPAAAHHKEHVAPHNPRLYEGSGWQLPSAVSSHALCAESGSDCQIENRGKSWTQKLKGNKQSRACLATLSDQLFCVRGTCAIHQASCAVLRGRAWLMSKTAFVAPRTKDASHGVRGAHLPCRVRANNMLSVAT